MAPHNQRRLVEGSRFLGFGCAFLLVIAGLLTIVDFTSSFGLVFTLGLAVLAGILGAKYGDSFHTWLLEKLRFLWWH